MTETQDESSNTSKSNDSLLLTQLKDALKRYGTHTFGCKLNAIKNHSAYRRAGGEIYCTCGWKQAAYTMLGMNIGDY